MRLRRDSRAALVLLGVAACAKPLDAPAPSVTAVSPSVTCSARDLSGVEVRGAQFLPLVEGAGTARPQLVLPRVFLSAAFGDIELTSVTVVDSTTLRVKVPAGLTEAEYALAVANPDGKRGTLAKAFTVLPPPGLSTVTPDRGFNGEPTPISVKGVSFKSVPSVVLLAPKPISLGGVKLASESEVLCTVPPGIPEGTYDLSVTSPEGCTAIKKAAFQVTRLPPITLASIEPSVGHTGAPIAVTMSGSNFAATPRAFLLLGKDRVALVRVAFLSPTSLKAAVPAGLPAGGVYDLVVENPANGGTATRSGAFTVTRDPPPQIDAVEPSSGVTNTPTEVTIKGRNFDPKAAAEIVSSTGQGFPITGTKVTPTSIRGLVPTSASGTGAFVIRVSNPDRSYGELASFVVRKPLANLGPFAAAPALETARQGLVALAGQDNVGGRFVYAVGGDDGAKALPTVEVARVDRFGRLGEWRVQREPMQSARTGHVAAISNGFLFVVGGSSDRKTPLETVERAQILGSDPSVPDLPVLTSATAAAGGSLAAGTWYYVVSAIMNPGDPDNPSGETVGSDEEVVRVEADGSTVTLSWKSVPGAISYRVYRTDGPDGRSGTARLLSDATGTTFTDDGKKSTDAKTSPLLPGSLGKFVPIPVSLKKGRMGAAGAVVADASGAVFLFVVGGASSSSDADALASYELAPFGGRGELRPFVTGGTALAVARSGLAVAVADPTTAPVLGTSGVFLFATGGFGPPSGGSKRLALSSTEVAEVTSGGQLTPFKSASSYAGERGGAMALLGFNSFHVFGGASATTIRDTGDSAQLEPCAATCPAVKAWNNSASRLRTGRAFSGSTVSSGQWFIAGGTDGAGVLGSVEQAIY
jgi:hypothetical protein